MKLDDFSFDLPKELIAQEPMEPRDHARLMVYHRSTQNISHHIVADLPTLLPPSTLVVANNSKVRHGRLLTTTGREVLIVSKEGLHLYRTIVRGKEPKRGDTFDFSSEGHPVHLNAKVQAVEPGPGMTTVIMHFSGALDIEAAIEKYGAPPLPPYIHSTSAPADRYQTVYAGPLGSAAAPTAGLHITPQLLQELKDHGHTWQEITLHVGLGTFLPLRNEEVTANKLHEEITEISTQGAHNISEQIGAHKPLLAIGTTSLRTLESHWNGTGVTAGALATELFLYPGKSIHTASALMTNFHLPKSSLLLLVAAFLGHTSNRTSRGLSTAQMTEELHFIYRSAIEERYRFFSYGDSMLIL